MDGLDGSIFPLAGTFSFQRIRAVKRIALRWNETGIRYDSPQFALVRAIPHSGGENDVLFDQDTADIIRPELQSDLAHLDAWCQPARLNMVYVVQI